MRTTASAHSGSSEPVSTATQQGSPAAGAGDVDAMVRRRTGASAAAHVSAARTAMPSMAAAR